jgi:patatin-like phospholipase/acyl hydrolase
MIATGKPDIVHQPRLLSLDGGGVRGLSSLLILREILMEIKHQKNTAEIPLPCEYFELIEGTSTGGLIAIMLGRLRMVPIHALIIV